MEFTGERFIECEETAGQLIEREHWQRYMAAAKLVKPGDRVLDIACGSGYGSAYLSRFAGAVYGVDISEDAVVYAQERYGRPKLRFLQGDVSKIPLDRESVDVVVSFETIEHVEEASQHAFLTEVKRILRPGGLLIVSCPNKPVASDLPRELWGAVNPYHKKEYTEEGFRALLAAYFPAVSMLYQRNEISLVMDAPEADTLSVQWGERKRRDDTQNLIAVCADTAVDVRGLSCVIPDISGQYIDSQRNLAKYVRTVQRQSGDIDRLAAEKAGLEVHSQELEAVIAGKDAEERQNSAFIQELEEAIAGKDAAAARNSAYIQALEAAIHQKDSEIAASTAHIQELGKIVGEQRDTIENLLRLEEAAKEEAKRLQADVGAAQGQITEIRQQARQMRGRIAELETIEQSRIWRMTGPVRRLADRAKRLFQ